MHPHVHGERRGSELLPERGARVQSLHFVEFHGVCAEGRGFLILREAAAPVGMCTLHPCPEAQPGVLLLRAEGLRFAWITSQGTGTPAALSLCDS